MMTYRKRNTILHVFLAAVLLITLAACSPVARPVDLRLRNIVGQADAPLASLAVVIVAGGEVSYEGYWGYRHIFPNQPLRNMPVTESTRFRVASISKVLTALGAMRLVEQGRLDLDRDVSNYLGFRLRNPNFPDRAITTRMLLSHTSSLRDAGVYYFPLPHTLADVFEPGGAYYANGAHFARPQPGASRAPGAYFTYANLNFGVLATVMEAVSGERFDRYMQRNIFGPLGIHGGFAPQDASGPGFGQLATLYTKQNGAGAWDASGPWYAQYDDYSPLRPSLILTAHVVQPHVGASKAIDPLLAYRPGTNATIFSPYAGLRISACDLAKVVLLLLDEGRYGGRQLFAPTTIRSMLREQWHFDQKRANGDTSYGFYRAWGLGLQHTTASQDAAGGDRLAAGSSETFWGHRGDAYGMIGGMWFDPERKVGFVYLIGGIGDDPLQHLGQASSFYTWEESIQAAVLDELARRRAAH